MTSAALAGWQEERAERLAQLVDAHQSVGGSGPGRRVGTEQLNWALILRVASEFQGFARQLHTESATVVYE